MNSALSMQRQARIINLIGFKGDIFLRGNTLANNTFSYESCSPLEDPLLDIDFSKIKETSESYPIYDTLDDLQFKHLISVRNHSYSFVFAENLV